MYKGLVQQDIGLSFVTSYLLDVTSFSKCTPQSFELIIPMFYVKFQADFLENSLYQVFFHSLKFEMLFSS